MWVFWSLMVLTVAFTMHMASFLLHLVQENLRGDRSSQLLPSPLAAPADPDQLALSLAQLTSQTHSLEAKSTHHYIKANICL